MLLNKMYFRSIFLLAIFISTIASPICARTFFQDVIDSKLQFSPRLLIRGIQIEGNRLIPLEEILSVLQTKKGAPFSKDLVLHDLKAINDLGYFVRDSIQATPEKTKDGGILLKIRIEENSPITGVQIVGNGIVSSEEILEIVQDLIAKPESVTRISQVLDEIEKRYQQRGFVLARVNSVNVDPDGVLTIDVAEGVIDKVVFEGNTKTKEQFLKRLAPNLKSGEPYNEILLVQDLRSLHNTGYFEDIQRRVKKSDTDLSKYDLIVEVKEKRTASFGFGGGLNSLSGAFGNVGFTNDNLFGEGKKVSLNSQLGSGLITTTLDDDRFLLNRRTVQAEARYTDPYFKGTNTEFSVFTNANTFSSYQVDLAREKSFSLGTSFNKPLGMNLFAGIELQGETVGLEEFSNSATNFLADQLVDVNNGQFLEELTEESSLRPGQTTSDRSGELNKENARRLARELRDEQLEGGKFLHLNPSISYDTRDNKMSPRSGWNNKLTFGHAVGLGNDSYSKLGVDVRRYVPVGKKATLAFNLRGASSIFGDIPAFNQFRAGGFYGVRGYRPFSDLGIGSRSLLASIEYRTPFLEYIPGLKNASFSDKLKLAFFSDFGYVGGNKRLNRLYNRLDTAASAGLGLRANIPLLGPIRVDYGLPLVQPIWDDSRSVFGRFNFGFAERF